MLEDQRILITGANGGIGLALCETLLQNGAKLVLLYHKKRTGIDELLKKYKNSHIDVRQVDLLDDIKIRDVIKSVLESGQIDTFIHSATLPIDNKSIIDIQWKDYQSHIEIQTRSFLQIVQSLIPSMKEKRRGKIIAILTSSVIGRPPSNMSDYIVGKYSLFGLTKSLAVELGHLGITVNCISPSMTNTSLIDKLPTQMKIMAAKQAPLGRLAEPSDVASVALFLCSKHSDYITGENFLVSGGQTMH